MPSGPDISFEVEAYRKGYVRVAGIDEAGRGCLAGPVVAAAVIYNEGCFIEYVDDSKKLSPSKREYLFDVISREALAIGIGIVDSREIDKINILNATIKAMKMAVENLAILPDYLLIDALQLRALPIPQQSIIKGDTLSFSIASASIIAKVTRDRLMADYHLSYPDYDFRAHKGYGTKRHIERLRQIGPCNIHRKSFLKNIEGVI